MFCVVIPTYNEAANIEELVDALEAECSGEDFRIIIVDDNSPDGTAAVATQADETYGNIIVHVRTAERGLATAVMKGIQLALEFPECTHIVTMDADLSHNPHEVRRLLALSETTDLIQGSRYVPEGEVVDWPLHRRLLSYTANALCRILLATGVHENTTNFRVYSRTLAQALLKAPKYVGHEFVPMSILVAQEAGLGIVEVGITFTNRKAGTSKMGFNTLIRWAVFLVGASWRRRILRRKLLRG